MADNISITASMPADLAAWLRQAAALDGTTPSRYVTTVMRDHQIARSEQVWREWEAALTGEDRAAYEEELAAYRVTQADWEADTLRAASDDAPAVQAAA
jgi:hypothetical protein